MDCNYSRLFHLNVRFGVEHCVDITRYRANLGKEHLPDSYSMSMCAGSLMVAYWMPTFNSLAGLTKIIESYNQHHPNESIGSEARNFLFALLNFLPADLTEYERRELTPKKVKWHTKKLRVIGPSD